MEGLTTGDGCCLVDIIGCPPGAVAPTARRYQDYSADFIHAYRKDTTIHENAQAGSQVIAVQQSLTDSRMKLVELLNNFSDCTSGNLLLSNSSRDRQQESRDVDQGH